jgi:hypothetical protein
MVVIMKSNVWSMLIVMCSFVSLQVRATVYAFAALEKGEQSIYLLANVQQDNLCWDSQKEDILREAQRLEAKLVVDDSYGNTDPEWLGRAQESVETTICFNSVFNDNKPWDEIKVILQREIAKISPDRLQNRGTLLQAWQELNNNALQNENDPLSNDQRNHLAGFLAKLAINQMLNAIEQSPVGKPIIICSGIAYIAEIVDVLINKHGVAGCIGNIASFANTIKDQWMICRNAVQAAQASGSPIDIKASIEQQEVIFLQQTESYSGAASSQPVESVENSPASEQITRPSRSWLDVAVCGFGVASMAALACIAIKNDFCRALKKILVPTLTICAIRLSSVVGGNIWPNWSALFAAEYCSK